MVRGSSSKLVCPPLAASRPLSTKHKLVMEEKWLRKGMHIWRSEIKDRDSTKGWSVAFCSGRPNTPAVGDSFISLFRPVCTRGCDTGSGAGV